MILELLNLFFLNYKVIEVKILWYWYKIEIRKVDYNIMKEEVYKIWKINFK